MYYRLFNLLLDIYLKISLYFYPRDRAISAEIQIPTRPYIFANGTRGIAYVYRGKPFMALDKKDVKNGISDIITNVCINDLTGKIIPNERITHIMTCLAGHQADFHGRAKALDLGTLSTLFTGFTQIGRIVCTNSSYEEYVFKSKEH